MSMEPVEPPGTEARDPFSVRVGGAALGGGATSAPWGSRQERAAVVVPVGTAEAHEELLDRREGAIALQRLEEIRSGRAEVVSADVVAVRLGL